MTAKNCSKYAGGTLNADGLCVKPMTEGVGWGLTAAGLSFAMLGFCYTQGFDLLSLKGARKVLIEWPDYPKLKARMLVAFGWCLVGALSGWTSPASLDVFQLPVRSCSNASGLSWSR